MLGTIWFFIKIILVLMLGGALIFAIATHLILYYEMKMEVVKGNRKEPISWYQMLKSIMLESCCDFMRFFLLPFAKINFKTRARENNSPPILLVHGYMQNQTDWIVFRHRLKKLEGIGPIYSLNLFPPFASITDYAKLIQQKVEAIREETQQSKIVLIGHSMGGLVCCYFAEYLANPDQIIQVITLGTPFLGTRLSVFGYGENIKEMYPNSELLTDLVQKMRDSNTPYYFVASQSDNLIIPWHSAYPDLKRTGGSDALILNDHGHLRLLVSQTVFEKIASWLKSQGNLNV